MNHTYCTGHVWTYENADLKIGTHEVPLSASILLLLLLMGFCGVELRIFNTISITNTISATNAAAPDSFQCPGNR